MHCYTQCPEPCSRPPLTHVSTGESRTRASLGQSLVGSLLLSPGSWCIQGSVCALQESISQSCVSSGGSMVGLMATSSKRFMPYPGLLHPEPLPLQQATADPRLCQSLLDTPRQVWISLLWGHCSPFSWVLAHTSFCLCPPRVCFPVWCQFWQLYEWG